MKRIGLLLILIVLVVKCSDVVTDNYKTYNDALKDDLFGSGWLPEFIPSSSFSITTSHNLDLNTSEGEFSFSPSASESFTTRLLPYSGRKSSYFDFDKLLREPLIIHFLVIPRLDRGIHVFGFYGFPLSRE